MGSRHVSPDLRHKILADWRTGEYSQRDLALKHEVSSGYVAKLTKGIQKDLSEVVSAGIKYRTELLQGSEHTAHALEAVVDAKTRHIAFFADATVKNVSMMMTKLTRKTTIDEHKLAQDAILKGRETVLGKSPDTAVQVNQTAGIAPQKIEIAFVRPPEAQLE